MFEKYGIMDFFCAIKRCLLILVVVFVVGFIAGACKDMVTKEEVAPVDMRPSYSSNQMFYFTYDDMNLASDQGVNYLKAINSGINIYMRSAFVDEYVVNYIAEKYGEDYLYEQLKVHNETLKKGAYTPGYLNTFTASKVLGDGISVSFTVTSKNKELTDVLFEGFMSYLDELNKTTYKDMKLVRFETYESVAAAPAQPAVSNGFNLKAGILFGMIFAVVALMVIFVWSLLQPKMNRKADFVNYDVDVLEEVSKKNTNADAIVQKYLRVYNQLEDSKVITLTTSMQDDSALGYVFNSMKEKFDKEFTFVEYDAKELDYRKWYQDNIKAEKKYVILIPSVIEYETALQVAKSSDVMVLAEVYGKTKYKNFERVIELVNSVKISLGGVIAIYE